MEGDTALILGLICCLGGALYSPLAEPSTAGAATQNPSRICTCNDYVARVILGYPDNASAPNLESHALQEAGFVQLRRPEPGAIALYQSYNPVSSSPNGHVEVVRSISAEGVQVATAGVSIPAVDGDAGCSNVQVQMRSWSTISAPGATFWGKY